MSNGVNQFGLETSEALQPAEACPPPAPDSVGRLARSGAKWSVSLLVFRQLFSIGTIAVVARILPPSDFGMVAMVGTLTNFLLLISDMGLSWATVQKDRLEQSQIDALFWCGAGFGGIAWAACALASPLMAEFYNTAQLVPLCIVLGASLLINGLAIQPTALLKRQMRQREFALSQTAALLIAGLLVVFLALAGAGYWALVAQNIVSALVLLAMSLYWSGYRPRFPKVSAHAWSLLKFGGFVGACNIVTYFQANLDSVLVGRYCGAEELGFYSRAYYLRTLPAMYAAMTLTDVMVPALAAIRNDRQRLQEVFIKAFRLIAFVGCPIAACLGVTADESVRLIYGPHWAPVVPLLIWLSLPAFVLPLVQTMGWLFIVTGKVRQMFCLSVSCVVFITIAYCVAIGWGAEGVAIANAAIYTVPAFLITMYWGHAASGLSMRRTMNTLLPVFLACLVSAAGSLAAGHVLASYGCFWLIVFAVKLMVLGILYLLVAATLMRPMPVSWLERYARLVVR